MRIVILGAGYVANAYARAVNFLGYHPLLLSRSWIDYTRTDPLRFFMVQFKPDLVINAAGYTGRSVDDCQSNKTECYQANVVVPRQVALLCAELKVKLLHVSSGCLFNGEGPFTEEDTPNFLTNFYQQCKHSAEQDILASGVSAWIIRLRMPFDCFNHPRNWLNKLCAYPKILDGLNSISFMGPTAMRSFQLV